MLRCLLLALCSLTLCAGEPAGERLWPGDPPGGMPAEDEQWKPAKDGSAFVRLVHHPRVGLPAAHAGALRPALIVVPGGGFNLVMAEKEGWQVAEAFALYGFACFPLIYRHHDKALALLDARRAVRFVRANAARFGVDPARIGMAGFSAGGQLAIATAAVRGRPEPLDDDLARIEARPDFLLLGYPSPLLRQSEDAVIDAAFPPTFFVCGAQDEPAGRVFDLAGRLAAAKIPVEAHVVTGPAHGFALDPGGPAAAWPAWATAWVARLPVTVKP